MTVSPSSSLYVHPAKFSEELVRAGIGIVGIDGNGVIRTAGICIGSVSNNIYRLIAATT